MQALIPRGRVQASSIAVFSGLGATRWRWTGLQYTQQRTIGVDGKTITYEDRTIQVTRERPPRRRGEWTNPATGEVMRITEGIDPGFDFNPGRHRPAGVRAALSRHVRGLVDLKCSPPEDAG